MKKPFSLWHFFIIIFLVPLAAYGTMVWYENKFQRLPVYGNEDIKNGKKIIHSIGRFELVNQDSVQHGSDNWNGKIAVVDFFFTHCPKHLSENDCKLKKEFSRHMRIIIK
ncbi:MAG: SCO family protein [Segetibacter sp.]